MSGPINITSNKAVLGIDESGKGDFFGPLVVAGVLTDGDAVKRLEAFGIRDSKKISDNKILEMSRWIKENYAHSVVIIGPEKYNQLYKKIKNLNKLLAWGHSRIIENLAAENKIDLAVSDKFGRDDFIERALMKHGRKIDLIQKVRGESIMQVAAASIVARATFVTQIKNLSVQYNADFPKGAGSPVDEAARILINRHGVDILSKTAKIHFKNYRKVLNKQI